MTIPNSGLLTPYLTFNPNIKQKYTYFIRTKREDLTMQNFRDVVTFGDMAGKPIDELSVLLEGVFNPLLTFPGNQKSWPRVVAKDVMQHVQDFKNSVEQVNYGGI